MVKLKTVCQNYLEENFWLAKRTRDGTERAVGYFVGHCGNLRLDQLRYQHFEKYKHFLVKSGRAKTTANIYLRAIHRVLNWSIDQGWIESDPMVKLKQYRVTRNPVRIYEPYQVARMVRYAPDNRWKAIILCAWTTGLRRGAILNLTLDNIRKGYVYVEPKRNTKATWEWEPKDKELRKVPLPEPVERLIKSLGNFYPFLTVRQYQKHLERKRLMGVLPEDIRRCPNLNFRRSFVAIQRKAFGRQIGDFHMLRKTYTTWMCEVLPEHFTMRLTGHNSLKTMTYYLASRESYYDIARNTVLEGIKEGMPSLQTHAERGVDNDIPTGRYGI